MKVNDINSNKLESRKFYSEEELAELFGIGKKETPVKQSDAFKVLQNIEMRKSGTHPVKFSDGYTVDIDPIIAKKINAWVAKRDKKDQAGAEGLVRSWEGFQKIAKVLGIQDKLPVPRTVEDTNESEKRWKQTSMSPAEAEKEYGKENVKVKKGALRNGDDMVEVFVEDTNEELNAILSLAGVSTMTPVQAIVAESKEEVTEMNKYGISAVHKGGKFYAFRHGKMVGGPFDTMQELQDFQLKSIENESYDMTPGGQVEYEFTKADFLANEDENMHTENAMELVAKFGTEEEIKRMEMIMTAHNTRGHIEPAEQEERDSYIRKYYPMLEDTVEEVASPEEQAQPSSVAMDTLRLIVTNKQNMPVKFADGQMKVDLYTASAITQVYDKVNDANKQKMLNMLGTKEGMVKLTNLVFGMLNKKESIGEGLEQDLVDMYKGDGEAGLADYIITHLGVDEKQFEKEFEKAGNAMKFIKNFVAKQNEGKSPHKKGTAKYKKHMAAMHAESLEISEDAYNRIEAFRDSRLQELSSTESDEVKGILEDFEKDEVKIILDKHDVKSIDDIELGSEVYEELFAYYMDSGEMPYGVMKARTGMPDEWIADRLDDLGLLEQNIESNNVFNNLQDVKRTSEGEENMAQAKAMRGSQFTDKQIKMAFGILNDPKFKGGNYSGAVEVINKVAPGLADHPSVANALKRANEACGAEHSPKKKKMEGRNDGPRSECCDAPLDNYQNELGICSDCGEHAGAHNVDESVDINTGKPVPKTNFMGVNVRSKEDRIRDKKTQIELAKRNAPKSGLKAKDVPQLEKELADLKNEGYARLPDMPEKYVARDGLEGPIMTRSGKVVYYDNVEGKYYDPDTDMYLTYDEWKAYDFIGWQLPIKQEDEVMEEKLTVTMADMKLNTKAYQNLLKGDEKYIADKELMKHILANGGREKLAASCNYESAELDRLKHLSGL